MVGTNPALMNIVIVYNPISGAGRSRDAGLRIAERLESAGHDVQRLRSSLQPPAQWLDPALEHAELVVVVGGDGAVRQAAWSAAQQDTALYHFPGGTENLFAREFRMDRMVSRLIAAIDRFETVSVDLADANGSLLVLMASIGIDAEVVHDLAGRRGASISHASYLMPMVRQFRRWTPAQLTVTVDGQRVVNSREGLVVVANSRQYAWRLDPVWDASMCDGLLNVVFHPVTGSMRLLGVLGAHLAHVQSHLPGAVYATGRHVRINSDEPVHFQVDGDPATPSDPGGFRDQRVRELVVQMQPKKLRVLRPL